MKTTRWTEGDPGWVFPGLGPEDAALVREALLRAGERIAALADHLGVRPGWTGEGLEYRHMPGAARADLFGSASSRGVEFVLDVSRVRAVRNTGAAPSLPGCWTVTAGIIVDCDQLYDCGGHCVEEREDVFSTPSAAARAAADGARWLWERGTAEPLGFWPGRNRPELHRLG